MQVKMNIAYEHALVEVTGSELEVFTRVLAKMVVIESNYGDTPAIMKAKQKLQFSMEINAVPLEIKPAGYGAPETPEAE